MISLFVMFKADFRGIWIVLLFLVLSSLAQAKVYRWVDEYGKVHYGDRPQQHVEQELINLKGTQSTWSRFDINIETIDVELTSEESRRIEDDVNNIYEFYAKVLFFNMYKTVPVDVLILENYPAYVKYLKSIGKERFAASYGLYIGHENKIIVFVQEDRQRTFKTIAHEVSHAIVDTAMPYLPTWLNEGLAEQMETLKKTGSSLQLFAHQENRSHIMRSGSQALTPISEFLKLPSQQWQHSLITSNSGILQSQTGQFVYFLLASQTKRQFIIRLMHKFKRGDTTLSYYLVDDNYIGGVKALELEWSSWLQSQQGDFITFY